MTEAQKEYIITEMQLQSIEDDFFTNETLRQIRSRPYRSDAVLDELRIWIEQNSFRINECSVNMIYTYKLADKLEEFRQQKER